MPSNPSDGRKPPGHGKTPGASGSGEKTPAAGSPSPSPRPTGSSGLKPALGTAASGPKPTPGSNPDLKPLNDRADLFTDSVVTIDPKTAARMKEAAPEVSQGKWRERAYHARGSMPVSEIESGLKIPLDTMRGRTDPTIAQGVALRHEWLPYLRQVVEQAGGDSLDGFLLALIGKAAARPGAKDTLVPELVVAMVKLHEARSHEDWILAAEALIARALVAVSDPAKRKVSLKVLEKDLEGRLDLDELLDVLFSSDAELEERGAKVRESLDQLRGQMKAGVSGAQPTGLLWNFTRLKAERLVIESEQKRRAQS